VKEYKVVAGDAVEGLKQAQTDRQAAVAAMKAAEERTQAAEVGALRHGALHAFSQDSW
jgi:hypothetical protein